MSHDVGRGREKAKIGYGFPKAWTHLWNSANLMLKDAPTVSRHLAHRLVSEGGVDMSSSAKELLCQKCGELAWTSVTRIRKRRRADRGKRNRVLKRCQTCNKLASHAGSSAYDRDRDRDRVRSAVDGSAAGTSVLTALTTPAATTKKKKKKKKKGAKTGMNRRLSDSSVAYARPSGLSTSFLFEDLEE